MLVYFIVNFVFLHSLQDTTMLYQMRLNVWPVPWVHARVAKDNRRAKCVLLAMLASMDYFIL